MARAGRLAALAATDWHCLSQDLIQIVFAPAWDVSQDLRAGRVRLRMEGDDDSVNGSDMCTT
jgi:hypothetical protein